MNEKINDVIESLKERIKNPIIFTFLFIWILKHWELIYSIFNFDKHHSLFYKLETIKKYLDNNSIWELLFSPLLLALTSILGYYCISMLSEAFGLSYLKWGRPFLYRKLDKNKIITKEEYEKLEIITKSLDDKSHVLSVRLREQSNEIEKKDVLLKEIGNENKRFFNENEKYKSDIENLNKLENPTKQST